MAKQLIGNGNNSYTFNATAKTVKITGITPTLTLSQILLINNVTRETIIYNPFVSGKGYSSYDALTGTLTLEFDTNGAGHNSADKLQIFYDNSDQALVAIADLSAEIKNLVNIIASPLYANSSGLIVGSGTISTVSSVSNVATVNNIALLGGALVPIALTDRLLNIEFADTIRTLIT